MDKIQELDEIIKTFIDRLPSDFLYELGEWKDSHLTQKTTVPKDGEVMISKEELEELKEKAWKYDDMCEGD